MTLKSNSIIVAVLVLCVQFFTLKVSAQDNKNSNPVFQNPYQNPYGTNPFGVNNQKEDKKKKINKTNQKEKAEPVKSEEIDSENQNADTELDNSQAADYYNSGTNGNWGEVSDGNMGAGDIPFDLLNADSVTKREFMKKKAKIEIYGMDFFNNNNFKPNDNNVVSPPSNYELGPGDEVIISVWGQSQTQKKYIIAKDGSIYTPFLGKIYLQGLSYESSKILIRNKFKQILAPNSVVDVQIGKVRTIRVRITGEVNIPGVYTISSFNSAINALSYVGGIKENGCLRNIRVIRGGQVIHTIDMYEFLRDGGDEEDVFLEDNDIINVELNTKLVKAEGAFKRPMYYQLKENEHLSALLKWSGGPSYDARTSLIQIQTVMDEETKVLDVNLKGLEKNDSTFELLDGDKVRISKVNKEALNTVTIYGGVNYPNRYQLETNQRLFDIIKKAGGLSGDAYTYRAFLYRQREGVGNEIFQVNLDHLMDPNDQNNLDLFEGDSIEILSKSIFKESFSINVSGEVRKPGRYSYAKNLTLKDLLINAGGIKLTAESGRIEISNIVSSADNFNINLKKNEIKVIKINPDLTIDEESQSLEIKPYDIIFVRKKVDFSLQETVFIVGEVQYPGEYAKLYEKETISSVLSRAGGFKEASYLEGTYLLRKKQGPIAIDVERAIKYKGSTNDLILQDGDTIFIPGKSNIVNITGQVQRRVSMNYDNSNTSVKYYIGSAGGFSESPWKDRITVTYPNGKSKSTKRIFFIRKYPKVQPGSIVNVPRKPEKKNEIDIGDVFTGAATIISTLGTATLLYKTITN